MEDTTKVLDLLDELEDILDEATSVPLTNKVVIETDDIFAICKDIRLSLPDDIQQAKWIVDERDRILEDAKNEYERIIREAKKQADYLVETDEITKRATKLANDILEDAQVNSKMLKMKTYDYVDRILYDMQGKMRELNAKYIGAMLTNIDNTFENINSTLEENRVEIDALARKTNNETESEQ